MSIIYGSSCPKNQPRQAEGVEKRKGVFTAAISDAQPVCIELAVARKSRHSNLLIIWLNT